MRTPPADDIVVRSSSEPRDEAGADYYSPQEANTLKETVEMFCDRCGTNMDDSANFCAKCGKSFTAAPLMPAQGRIAGHVRLLGILWIALSAFRMLPGVVLLLMTNPEAPLFPPDAPAFLVPLLRGVGMCFLVAGALGLAAGWGLVARQHWARMLAIILGCLGLLDMPFGTALGIYTFWVLLPAQSEQEYRQLASAPSV